MSILSRIIRSTESILSNFKRLFPKHCLTTVHSESRCFRGTLREAIGPFLAIGQFFGVLPLVGTTRRSVCDLKFKWNALTTFYSLFVMTILTCYSFILIWHKMQQKNNYSSIAVLLFYISNNIEIICLFVLARKWPELMQYWEEVEEHSTTFRIQRHRRNFIYKIRVIGFTIIALTATENILATHSKLLQVINHGKEDPVSAVISVQVPLGELIDYPINPWIAMFAKYININSTFIWFFMDIFLTSISLALTIQFKLFNEGLKYAKNEYNSRKFWTQKRMEYGRLRNLVNTVDKAISHIILITFFNHFVVICKTLYKSLKPHRSHYRMVYFFYSITIYIFRASVVSFSATCINDESKKPIKILRILPSQSWDTETKRFFDEIVRDTIALSGMRFFFITRKLILSVIGTIATYELVLAQFYINDAYAID